MTNKIAIGCGIAAAAVTVGLGVEHQINKTRQGTYALGGHRTVGQGSIVQKTAGVASYLAGHAALAFMKVLK